MDTLHHSPHCLESIRELVLKDIEYRSIKFPEFCHLIAPIRSTYTGELLDRQTSSGIACTGCRRYAPRSTCQLGPRCFLDRCILPTVATTKLGTGLMRSTQKAFKSGHSVCIDLTSGDTCGNGGDRNAKQEPIAIVGMTVNMPGAPNTAESWEVLERGINTCSEVTCFSFRFCTMLIRFPQMYK
jgi:hypothetical protein